MNRHPSDPSVNATVMASAGTGKTWLLVTRLVRLLFDGVQPDAILAITFTRKAAAEMQTRLAERLLQLASLDDAGLHAALSAMGMATEPAAMARARCLYEALLQAPRPLRTTTFHAFCQEILRRFPLEADVPPGFELVEKTGELRGAAWEALIGDATAAPDGALAADLLQLLELCSGQNNLSAALDSFLDHRSDWWAYTADAQQPTNLASDTLRQKLQIDPEVSPLQDLFDAELLAEAVEFRNLLQRHSTKTNDEHVALFGIILDEAEALTARYQTLRTVFLTQAGQPRSRKPSKVQAQKMEPAGEERFLLLHQKFCERLAELQGQLAALDTWRMNDAWYRCGERLLQHYQRIKEERRQLDFTDLEWRAYRLLTAADNAHWVQFKLDQRIDHLLVDEFQDTNPTQWRLLLPLLQEMAAGESERRRSVFLVGDGKQSIYRFRRAEPRLFHVAHDWLQENLQADAFPLHVSRRSAPAIMQCVNALFSPSGPLEGVLDGFAAHDTHHGALWGRVELLPLVEAAEAEEPPPRTTLRHPLQEPRLLRFDDRYQREGQAIAAQIQSLITAGTLLGAAEQARPMHYGDVLILVRNRTHVADYEEALRAAGIPYIGADRGTLLESLEVDDMVRLLETLIAPYNNLALAQVLRSPLFDCSDADLTALAASGERGTWFERLPLVAAALPVTAPLRRAADALARWHGVAGSLPIHDLLDRVYSEGNIIARYEAAFPPHLQPRVRANLTRFIELALEIDNGRYPSLTGFLTRLGELREQNEAPDEAPASGAAERVRLMTIHASKGLEAPVVFLADTAAGGGADRPYHALVEWPAENRRPDYLLLVGRKEQQDPFTQARLAREQQAEQREAANLLYVALTRAKQLLYISACRPGRGDELGWYGLLQQALGSDAHPVLESGAMPAHAAESARAPEASVTKAPAALRAPLTIRRLRHEIAPSRYSHGLGADGADEDGRLRGIAIHRMLQLGEVSQRQEEILPRVAAELRRSPHDAELRSWWQEAAAVRQAPQLRDIFDRQRFEQAWCEVPLHYRTGEVTVNGIIDRLILQQGELVIVDYKTHRGALSGQLDAYANAYREQLRYYAEGVRRLWPKTPVRALLLFTALRETVEVSLE